MLCETYTNSMSSVRFEAGVHWKLSEYLRDDDV